MKKISFTFLVIALAIPSFVSASVFGGGPVYSLPADQAVQGNLYAGGGTVNVLGSVSKDVMVGGGNVSINGLTTANVMAAGGNVNMNGFVGQDLRAAGGTVLINSKIIGGELVVAAGNVIVSADTSVAGDAYLAGGRVEINGAINGITRIAASEVIINGPIGRDTFIRAEKLTLGPKAVINGNLNYKAESKANIDPAARVTGQTVFTMIEVTKEATNPMAWLAVAWFLKLIAYTLAALLAFFVMKRHSTKITVLSTEHFWGELLRGLIILVVTPIAILIVLVTVVGWVLALIGLFAYLLLIFVAGVYGIFTATGLLQKYAFKQPSGEITWQKLLLGSLVLFIISLIPFIGWIISFGIFLAALGALTKVNYVEMHVAKTEDN